MLTFKQLGRYGRFANGMFQIAGVIGIAEKNGYQWAFPKWVNYNHWDQFGSSEDIEVQKYFENPLPVLDDPDRFQEIFVNWGFHGFRWPDNISLAGHFQAPRYFDHCMDIIKHYFRMKNEPPQSELVAVHYRAGDYTEGADTYHPRCTKEYYQKALSHFPGAEFMVFSDSMTDAEKIFWDIPGVRYSLEPDYIQDFKVMKRCKSFIISNSSYSLMAALLGEHPEKKIVCPSLWFGAVAGINGNDCYPEGAIII